MEFAQRDQVNRGRSILAFKTNNADLFGAGKAKSLSETIAAEIETISELGTQQDSAGGGAIVATQSKNALVASIRADMLLLAGTARTIRKNDGALDYPFVMPESEAADVAVSVGRAFFDNASSDAAKPQFLDWDVLPAVFTDLQAALDAYEGKVQTRDDKQGAREGGTDDLEDATKRLIHAIDGLDTVMKNKLARPQNEADKRRYAEWKQAAKLVRTPAHHASPTPPAA